MYSNLDTELLTEQELRALINQAQRRVQALESAKSWRDFVDDERVVATSNAVLMLAYKAAVPKDEVFRLIAGALRLPLRDVALSAEELEAVASNGNAETASTVEVSGSVASAPEASAEHSKAPNVPESKRRRSSTSSRTRAKTTNAVRPYGQRSGPPAHSNNTAPRRSKERALYVHPANKNQCWDGHGEMPKWLRDALAFGRSLEEFRA